MMACDGFICIENLINLVTLSYPEVLHLHDVRPSWQTRILPALLTAFHLKVPFRLICPTSSGPFLYWKLWRPFANLSKGHHGRAACVRSSVSYSTPGSIRPLLAEPEGNCQVHH